MIRIMHLIVAILETVHLFNLFSSEFKEEKEEVIEYISSAAIAMHGEPIWSAHARIKKNAIFHSCQLYYRMSRSFCLFVHQFKKYTYIQPII